VESREPSQPIPHEQPHGKRRRLALFLNGALGASSLEYSETRIFELFVEDARVTSRYRDPGAPVLEIGGQFLLKDPLGMRASVELTNSYRDAAYEAFLPHPFYYERFRELSGRLPGLIYRERAVHLDAVYSRGWGSRLFLEAFAGPSLFLTRTEILTDVLYSEIYPYDVVVSGGADAGLYEDMPFGFNVGASAVYRLTDRIAVGFGLRFSQARVRISPRQGGMIEFDAGGLRAGTGIRMLFR